MGSRGSVIPYFKDLTKQNIPLPITDLRMTRFWIEIDKAVEFILTSLEIANGGELFVPKIPSMKLIDLAKGINPNAEIIEIGIRPGEKLHEEMISLEDSRRTIDLGDRYLVTPVVAEWGFKSPNSNYMPEGFAYRSDTNSEWLSLSQIQNIVQGYGN